MTTTKIINNVKKTFNENFTNEIVESVKESIESFIDNYAFSVENYHCESVQGGHKTKFVEYYWTLYSEEEGISAVVQFVFNTKTEKAFIVVSNNMHFNKRFIEKKIKIGYISRLYEEIEDKDFDDFDENKLKLYIGNYD